jgi:hypothetical protein
MDDAADASAATRGVPVIRAPLRVSHLRYCRAAGIL